ncbi:hypothetical protein [Caulobacter hibisci]|uniref:Uncharacterized protein n=1 Tax=Caulobacter hibisci TaxID=2035993 RepID=A0ABS0SUV3_9CAUL|nr:hypothetical protein [Caulobacter hibisci]MBI1683420.1 hypothetical protein [Caulobacter hibisci]
MTSKTKYGRILAATLTLAPAPWLGGAGSVLADPGIIAPAFSEKTYVITRGAEGSITTGRMSLAGRGLPDPLPATFAWKGEVLEHRPTGLRFPRTHAGCRLAGIAPLDATGYQRGGQVEYDCRPETGLTYVTVVFEGGASSLAKKKPEVFPYVLAQIAAGITTRESKTYTAPCKLVDLTAVSGHVNRGFVGASCGARWATEEGGEQFGTAAYILGRGQTYAAFTSTCAGEKACDARLTKLGPFLDSFDVSTMKGR